MFLQDLEEDPEFRANVNIYQDDEKAAEKVVEDGTAAGEEAKKDGGEDDDEDWESAEEDMPEVKATEILKDDGKKWHTGFTEEQVLEYKLKES